MNPFKELIKDRISVVFDETIRLGTTNFRLVSNVTDFAAPHYFSKSARKPFRNDQTDFEIWCISLKNDRIDEELILKHVDKTYRGSSFSDGYYATDHFGSPVYLVTTGKQHFIFGENLEKVVWAYFVKYFLLLHTIETGSLFLKSAAFTINEKGTLLLGRGGTGKTSVLSILCMHGARFVTNSHALVKNERITGVASSLRIRPDQWMMNLLKPQKKMPALRPDEIIVDPFDQFEFVENEPVELKNICIVDYRDPARHVIERISDGEVYNYAEQFALGINVYRLEEDLLDYYKGDFRQFSDIYELMKNRLQNIVAKSNRYYISSNLLEQKYRDEVIELVS